MGPLYITVFGSYAQTKLPALQNVKWRYVIVTTNVKCITIFSVSHSIQQSISVMVQTFTSYLASLSTPVPYEAATSHQFLRDAADLTLPHDRLAFWLAQDRIYAAQAYPRFIALLITKIPLDSTDPAVQVRSRRTLQVLVGCLDNIVREVNFFEDTARRYDLDVGDVEQGEGQVWRERKATRDYTAEMARIASLGTLEDGLVFLWAMEKVSDRFNFTGLLGCVVECFLRSSYKIRVGIRENRRSASRPVLQLVQCKSRLLRIRARHRDARRRVLDASLSAGHERWLQ